MKHEAPPAPDALAVRLRRELSLSERSFDLAEVVESMGFKVQRCAIPGGAEGLTARIGEADIILLDPTGRSERRQRFTLAHELGHCLLEHTGACSSYDICAPSKNPEEEAANRFATALLIPLSLFREDVRRVAPSMASIESLADAYDVSRTALALRYVRFTDDACALLGVGTTRSWLIKSQSAAPWWIRSPPPEGSLVHEWLSGRAREKQSRVDAAVWIENFQRRTTVKILEEATPTGDDSWLVLLSELPDPDDDPDADDNQALDELERRRMSFRRH